MLVLPFNLIIYIFFNVLAFRFITSSYVVAINSKLVGPNGLEPSTSRLSGVRSDQLSYGPIFCSYKLRSALSNFPRASSPYTRTVLSVTLSFS